MKVVHRFPCSNNEEAHKVARVLQRELGKYAVVQENFDVIVIEEHVCIHCDPIDKEEHEET